MSSYVNPQPLHDLIRGCYYGQNLETVFNEEIKATKVSNVESPTLEQQAWTWIYNKINNCDIMNIYPGDWLPITINSNYTYNAKILGINTYRWQDSWLSEYRGFQIDFMMNFKFSAGNPITWTWNSEATNSGKDKQEVPWLASDLYTALQTLTVDSTISSHIIEKELWMETKPYAEEPLLSPTGAKYVNLGKFWLPTEYEIIGHTSFGYPKWSAINQIQYPLFQYQHNYGMIKANEYYGSTYYSCTTTNNSSSDIVVFSNYHFSSSSAIALWTAPANSSNLSIPICFRIQAGDGDKEKQ